MHSRHHLAQVEVIDLNLYVAVHLDDLVRVEVVVVTENLLRYQCESMFREGTIVLEECVERSQVHVLHRNGNSAEGFLEEAMVQDYMKGIRLLEDVYFSSHLASGHQVGIGVDHLAY